MVANQVVTNDEEEMAYLQKYFGAPPDPYQLARFFLMRQLAHMFYAMAYLLQGASGTPIDWSDPVPEFSEFHRLMWAGKAVLADEEMKIVYGRVHWERLLQNVRRARYREALRIVADRRRF